MVIPSIDFWGLNGAFQVGGYSQGDKEKFAHNNSKIFV